MRNRGAHCVTRRGMFAQLFKLEATNATVLSVVIETGYFVDILFNILLYCDNHHFRPNPMEHLVFRIVSYIVTAPFQ